MSKVVFLDRDGTINVDKHYLYKVEEFEFIPGVIEGLQMLSKAGYELIVITNQSGIGRGYYTEEDFQKLNQWMVETLKSHGVKIRQVYYCPHLPDAQIDKYRIDCNCRKPKLGMYHTAVQECEIEVECSYAIGDRLRDCAICESSLCKGFLVGTTEKKEIIEKVKSKQVDRVRYAHDLLEAARTICMEEM